jgi:predicted phage tail protein
MLKIRLTHKAVSKMCQYGGRFEHYLAKAWYVADDKNKQKLEETFAELFAKFADLQIVDNLLSSKSSPFAER